MSFTTAMYHVVDKTNINIQFPVNSNLVNFSVLKEFYSPIGFRSFSIKYVVQGHEKYKVNGNDFHVRTGDYLLANAFCEGSVEIDSKQEVTGICIDVSPTLLSAVVASYLSPDSPDPDIGLDRFFNSPEFLEDIHRASETQLGRSLRLLGYQLRQDPFGEHVFTEEFYYTLAENLVADHREVYQRVKSIKALKLSTRKDLYRKLQKGKQLMDQGYASPLNMASVAAEATLSEYHFFRLFKMVYGTSPNQYLLKKRLEKAYQWLQNGYGPVSSVALQAGFTDVFGFSKAFKKQYGFSPSRLIARN